MPDVRSAAAAGVAIALLAALALPAASSMLAQDETARCVETLNGVWKQVEQYRKQAGSFPSFEPVTHAWNEEEIYRHRGRQGRPPAGRFAIAPCPSGHSYRLPSADLNSRKGDAAADPIVADPLTGVRRTPHGDARTAGANVLHRDGSVRKVTLKEPEAWRAMLVGTTQNGRVEPVSPGDSWTFRTSEDADLRIQLAIEAVPLEGSVQLQALVWKDSKGRERWRDVVYPTDKGWRFFKRSIESRVVPVKPTDEGKRKADELIEQLNSDDPFERMGAAEKIAGIWFDARDAVEEMIAKAGEPEVVSRLRQALATGVQTSGPMLLALPLVVGARWETAAGEGHHLRHEVQDETFIVTAIGEAHCFKIRTESEAQVMTMWLEPSRGPLVVQLEPKPGGSKVEWRLEAYAAAEPPGVWVCPACGGTVGGGPAAEAPACGECGVRMRYVPSEKQPVPVPRQIYRK